MYGEWLREQFDKGAIPEPTYDPDLAILLSQLRENSINLFGPEEIGRASCRERV